MRGSAPAVPGLLVVQSGGKLTREMGTANFSPQIGAAGVVSGCQMDVDAARAGGKGGMRRSLSFSNLHDR
jgi:hypothetical protein